MVGGGGGCVCVKWRVPYRKIVSAYSNSHNTRCTNMLSVQALFTQGSSYTCVACRWLPINKQRVPTVRSSLKSSRFCAPLLFSLSLVRFSTGRALVLFEIPVTEQTELTGLISVLTSNWATSLHFLFFFRNSCKLQIFEIAWKDTLRAQTHSQTHSTLLRKCSRRKDCVISLQTRRTSKCEIQDD